MQTKLTPLTVYKKKTFNEVCERVVGKLLYFIIGILEAE